MSRASVERQDRGDRAGTQPREFLVGAAIGLGMTARAAAQGGADFLLALNAGRLRVMGAASNAAMLPLRDSNSFTDAFARTEILGRVACPVLFGACVFDPGVDLDALVADVADAGYAGLTNFPSAIHFDGSLRAALEAAGLGFSREVDLLTRAKASGLDTLGYAKTSAEAVALARAGVAKLCLNFGWNAGGTLGIPGVVTLEDAVDRARRLFGRVRRISPGTLCFVEGGPIVLPRDARQVCGASKADGYIGGSTLDRLPLEMSVMQTTSAFKSAPLLSAEDAGQLREQQRIGAIAGLIGQSDAITALRERIAQIVATDLAVLIVGEAGAGKTTAARAVHVAGRRSGPFHVFDSADASLHTQLFGAVEPGALDIADATVVVEGIERLPEAMGMRLAAWVERGVQERFQRRDGGPLRARLVLTRTTGRTASAGVEALHARLAASEIVVPALRDRPEDLPLLVRALLATARRAGGGTVPVLEPRALRLLVAHDWPGNLRELSTLVARASARAKDGLIDADMVRALVKPESERPPATGLSERDWILDALRRHRFRRGAAAEFLGLSRKTLYNKMRRLGIGA